MPPQPVWILYFELKPASDCDWEHRNEAGSIFVEAYVPTNTIDDALASARDAIRANGFLPIDVDRCVRFDEDEWDDENDPEREVRSAVAECVEIDEVVFGPINWSPEA